MKTRRCSLCRQKIPEVDALISSLRAFCSVDHLLEYSKTERAKQQIKKAVRKETKQRKEKLKTRSDWQKQAQKAFNQYIRERDREKPCVSCGALQGVVVRGGAFDAGHYRSRGSAPHLAFDAHNCHSQCVKCNRFLGGNIVEYRKELIARIGIEKLEMLEQDNRPRHYTVEDFRRIIKICKKRKRQCQK
jgi:hypothetical protein